jgi:hypothetical protein
MLAKTNKAVRSKKVVVGLGIRVNRRSIFIRSILGVYAAAFGNNFKRITNITHDSTGGANLTYT